MLSITKAEAQSSVLVVADSLYKIGNYSKSIEAYKKHLVKEATFKPIAKSYLALGNYGEAVRYYERAHNTDTTDVLLKYDYAKLLARMKQYKKAMSFFNDLIHSDDQNPNFHYELGLVQQKLTDTSGSAQKSFKTAFDLDETHQKAIYKLALNNLLKRDFVLVDQYVDKGLASYANNKQLINLKAQNFYWQEMYDDAAIWFEKLIALGESSQFIHEKLSFCYVRLYDNKNALIHCEKALKYQPKNPTNLYILGQIYQQEHDYINAEKYYKMSIEVLNVPIDVEYIKLATVLNAQEKYDEAIKTLRKALIENPDNMQAKFFMLTTKSAYYKDIDEKIKLHEAFIEKHANSDYSMHAEFLLSKLKKEKFMAKD